MKRTERNMRWARSYIRNFTLGEEDERERFLRSDESLQALLAQLDGLRPRSRAFPTTGFKVNVCEHRRLSHRFKSRANFLVR